MSKTKCYWCSAKATLIDYRTIDGITNKIPSCSRCATKSTDELISRQLADEKGTLRKEVEQLKEKVAELQKEKDNLTGAYLILMEEYFDGDISDKKWEISKRLDEFKL